MHIRDMKGIRWFKNRIDDLVIGISDEDNRWYFEWSHGFPFGRACGAQYGFAIESEAVQACLVSLRLYQDLLDKRDQT